MRFVMTKDAVQNYGEKWKGVILEVTSSATKYMPSEEFFRKGKPEGFHPGYDAASRSTLYDLRRADTKEDLPMSLYRWELNQVN